MKRRHSNFMQNLANLLSADLGILHLHAAATAATGRNAKQANQCKRSEAHVLTYHLRCGEGLAGALGCIDR
jgi:hypothetical protein